MLVAVSYNDEGGVPYHFLTATRFGKHTESISIALTDMYNERASPGEHGYFSNTPPLKKEIDSFLNIHHPEGEPQVR